MEAADDGMCMSTSSPLEKKLPDINGYVIHTQDLKQDVQNVVNGNCQKSPSWNCNGALLPLEASSSPSEACNEEHADDGELLATGIPVENGQSVTLVESVLSEKGASTGDSLSQSDQSLDIDVPEGTGYRRKSGKKKRVNICTNRDDFEEDEEDRSTVETTALRRGSETSDSVADHSAISCSTDGCLTMSGTIKRGKKAGQNVDVKLNISREELEDLEAAIACKEQESTCSPCNVRKGPHVLLWTILCFPFAVIISGLYSFYIGTLTWYNVFTYYTEEKPVYCRILVAPVLILLFPFLIIIFTISLGIYAGVVQVCWYFDSWYKEITDLEKGFYGWLCSVIKHEDCAPYEVVILTEIRPPSAVRSCSEDSTI